VFRVEGNRAVLALLRAVEVYEIERIDFAEAYLVACAESTGVERVASFDRSLDRVHTVERVAPARTAALAQAEFLAPVVRRARPPSSTTTERERQQP
jgi:hypothetical protein